MEAITKYKARDGSEWASEAEARATENLLDVVDEIMAPLGPPVSVRPEEYVQHNAGTVLAARAAIVKLCAKRLPGFPIFHHEPAEEVSPFSVAGRILDDIGGPLSVAWCRFMKIDDQGREWEQPYFVLNTPRKPVLKAHHPQ
jgi:hypothetical protein